MLEIIENPDVFERLRDEWDGLLAASARDGPFLTWEWLHSWWKHLAGRRRLHLIVAREGGELAAITPLSLVPVSPSRLMPVRSLEFLGTGSAGSDYLDLIVRRGCEEEVLEALTEGLLREKLLLRFEQVGRGPGPVRELSRRLASRGWGFLERPGGVCPYVGLSGRPWSEYLAGRGREHRYAFRRKFRGLTRKFDVSFELARSDEARREALASLISLHTMRWKDRGGSDAFHTAALRAFHEEATRLAFDRGWLRLYVLRLDGRAAAAVYGFLYGGVFYFYQSGFHPALGASSVGLVALGLSIQAAIEEGAKEYDFLHGDEAYKFHWASDVRELCRLELYPPRGRGLLLRNVVGASRLVRGAARRVLAPVAAASIALSSGAGAR